MPVEPKPNWKNAPVWANWWAVEPTNMAYWHEAQPDCEKGYWSVSSDNRCFHDGYVNTPLGYNWRGSLHQRPQVGDGENKNAKAV